MIAAATPPTPYATTSHGSPTVRQTAGNCGAITSKHTDQTTQWNTISTQVGEPLPHAGEAKFTTSSMWSNEGARFAAIDIEATPIDEPAERASWASAEAPESFGFNEDTSAYTTQPERAAEVAAPVAEAAATMPAANAAASTVELSPALMDEIVRRVVAQLSESVVREIAWEVVPDCVERVIKEITAQEVAKR